MLQSIFGPLWQPMKDQLSLFRALATGGRIPGTNLILMPVAAGKCRFGLMEHFMMALAGAWLLFRVVYCELKDMKSTKRQHCVSCVAWNEKNTDTETTTTTTTTTNNTTTITTVMTDDATTSPTDQHEETNDEHMLIDTDSMFGDETEAIFYWGCHRLHKQGPIFRFTRLQLEEMLRMDQDEGDGNEYSDDSDEDIIQHSDDDSQSNSDDNGQSNSNNDKKHINLDINENN